MKTHVPFSDRLQLAGQLVARARIFYDIWWFYEGADTRPKIIDTMNMYSEFFRFDSHANFVALVVYLGGLFEKRADTINLPALVSEAGASGTAPADVIAQAKSLLAQVEALQPKVAILRSNLFAHRSASLSYAAAFRKAAIEPNQLRELTEVGLRVVNLFLVARRLPEQVFHGGARQHAEALLKALTTRGGT